MRDRLIFLACDADFLVPTISVALQCMDQDDIASVADVIIYSTGVAEHDIIALNKSYKNRNIIIHNISDEISHSENYSRFFESHVPTSTLIRLYAGAFIPDEYNHLIYLDGDIFIRASINDLVKTNAPSGLIRACNDQMFLQKSYFGGQKRHWDNVSQYASSLKLDPNIYFNAGVLSVERQTWIEGARKALSFFHDNMELCRCHDQSALNVIFKDRVQIISPRFNFITKYQELGLSDEVNPAILHFTGGRKPWLDPLSPHFYAFNMRFRNMIDEVPTLKKYSARIFPACNPRYVPPTLHFQPKSYANRKIQYYVERARFRKRFKESGL